MHFKRYLRRYILLSAIFVSILTIGALAAGSGINQWPEGRISYRLDTHYGQIASNAPTIPLYLDQDCQKPNGSHRLFPGDWIILYPNGAVTYPITAPQSGGSDYGLIYTTHFIRQDDHKYIASGTGCFSGANWDENRWWNGLPTNITYTSVIPGNGDTVYVGNNTGDFQVIPQANGYYYLESGDWSDCVMSASLSQYCYYDSGHSDYVNANYNWNCTYQPWTTEGLNQGTNNVYYAGMDASGNFATGQRIFRYDTLNPIPACSFDIQKGIITVSADDNKNLGAGTYSGLDFYQYRLSDDDGATWSGWSATYTAAHNITLATPGVYSIQVCAVDKAGNSATRQWDGLIKRSLPTSTTANSSYHTDIDVISSIKIKNTCQVPILPTDNFTVKLDIPGITTQTKAFVIPGNNEEIVWFKWHTPKNQGKINAVYTIHTDSKDIQVNAAYTISQIQEVTPPDPKARDKKPSNFYVTTPTGNSASTLTWTHWDYENGMFKQTSYTASLLNVFSVSSDSYCPTSFRDKDGYLNMKSGYGITENVFAKVMTTAPATYVTAAQNAEGFYPEFMYKDYFRLFDKSPGGLFQLSPNKYSMFNSRTHFTPVWYPDGDYTVQICTFDAWTPAGMLTKFSNRTIHINGSVFDDWHSGPVW